MNKFLRYSLSLVLAFVASVTFAQEVTFDFDNDYKTLFPELTGTSSSNSKDGDITKAMTCTTNGISVTVSAKTSGSNENRIWSTSPRLRMYSGTLTIQAPADKKIASIDIINKKWDDNNKADVGTNIIKVLGLAMQTKLYIQLPATPKSNLSKLRSLVPRSSTPMQQV